MSVKIQLRRDTASVWTSRNPILSLGEQGFETDTGQFKIGNGSDVWSSLDYVTSLPSTGLTITKTGDWARFQPQVFVLTPPLGVQIAQQSSTSEYTRYTGKFISSWTYTESTYVTGQTRILTLAFDDLAGMTASLSIASMAGATSISFPVLNYVGAGFSISAGFSALTTLSFPLLSYIGQNVTLSGLTAFTSAFSFPQLKWIGGTMSLTSSGAFSSFSMPLLVGCSSTFAYSTSSTIMSFSFPSLAFVGGAITFSSHSGLTSFDMTALKYGGGNLTLSSNTLLTSFTLPVLNTLINSLQLTSCTSLTTVALPTDGQLKYIGGVTITSAALTSGSVNNIMQSLSTLDGTNGTTSFTSTVDISGGTSAVPTPLSTASIAGSSFSGVSTLCTVNTATAHGYTTGDVLQISGITTLTNANRYAVITVTTANQFTYAITSQTATGAGTATVRKHDVYVKALVTRGVTLTTN